MQCSIRPGVAKPEIGNESVKSLHDVVAYFVVKQSTKRAIRLQAGLRLPCTSFLPNTRPRASPPAINAPQVCRAKPSPAPKGTEALITSSGTSRNRLSLKLRRIASPQVQDALYFLAASKPTSTMRLLSKEPPSCMVFHSFPCVFRTTTALFIRKIGPRDEPLPQPWQLPPAIRPLPAYREKQLVVQALRETRLPGPLPLQPAPPGR